MDKSALAATPPPSTGRLMVVPLIAIVLWIALQISYNLLGYIDNKTIYRTLAAVNWVLLVLSTGFSVTVIYPIAYFKGVSLSKRILVSYMVPFVWCLKEFIRVSGNNTAAEALYYAVFESVQLLVLISQVALMGICELACRWIKRRKTGSGPLLTSGPIIAIICSVIPLYFILIYESGHVFSLKLRMIYRYLLL